MHSVTRNIGGRTMTMETGRVAKQADGAVIVRYEDTEVLVTVVRAEPREGIDFFPLTMEYREMTYAAGRFPGGFFKREGRPSTKETLTMRMMDRPVRPLFPEGYREEVQVVCTVLSADKENDSDVLAVTGASAAISISRIPFLGPIAAVRVGLVDGELVINPTVSQIKESDFNIVVVASREGVVMMEGSAREVEEEAVLGAISFGFEQAQEILAMQEELMAAAGVPKIEVPEPGGDSELVNLLVDKYMADIEKVNFIPLKKDRSREFEALLERIVSEVVAEDAADGPTERDVKKALQKIEETTIRKAILEGRRQDGRRADEVREITCEVGTLARTHGSALFTRGETQALVVTTLGTKQDEQKIDGLNEAFYKRFLFHYNFPPFSVGEVKPIRGPGRRDIGHGMLAERSLDAVLPGPDDFPYTLRIVSEILESNGSSSMASVCGATLSLMDAGVPIKRPVAGIAMGAVIEGDRVVPLTDIAGAEDHCGDMDLKVAGTQKGITGLQMDIKVSSIKVDFFEQVLTQAKEARLHILREMLKVLPEPREDVSENAPKITRLKINPELIGSVIGPGGKMVRALQEETGTKVEIDDDGTVTISGETREGVDQARERVEGLTLEVKPGDIFEAKVVNIRENLGAFVEIAPGKDALLHISEISNEFVKDVASCVEIGQVVRVKVIRVDDGGKIRVSKKALESGGGERKERDARR